MTYSHFSPLCKDETLKTGDRTKNRHVHNCTSTADTCKNCAKCGKGFKIGKK